MTIPNLHSILRKVVALSIVSGSVMAAPVLADAIAGCVMPLLPKSDELTERVWEPRDLIFFLGEEARLEFESPNKEAISVVPHYTIWSRENGERPLVAGKGSAFNISPGQHPLNLLLKADTAEPLLEGLGEVMPSRSYIVSGARVHDHKENRLWSERDKATHAFTLDVSDAKPRKEGEATRSHMLVVYFAGGNAGNAGN